ncbi:hypothetical protein ACTI_42260 [Actinoplanes sp. OR16]|nr:hypothetical protein ACTI_42260 [Actinoplanes sp. OR16]
MPSTAMSTRVTPTASVTIGSKLRYAGNSCPSTSPVELNTGAVTSGATSPAAAGPAVAQIRHPAATVLNAARSHFERPTRTPPKID